MEYYKSGRFGRITKNAIKEGFEDSLEKVLYDSMDFASLSKKKSAEYVEEVINRMEKQLGRENTKKVLVSCGQQCCGKSWTKFTRDIKEETDTIEDFFELLNKREEPFQTSFTFNKDEKSIFINRSKCLCGLVNKAKNKFDSNLYCECSTGHFLNFFDSIFNVESIELKKSILNGSDSCQWIVKID